MEETKVLLDDSMFEKLDDSEREYGIYRHGEQDLSAGRLAVL